MLRGLKTFQSFSVVCGLSCSLALEAQAANFGSGGGIYYANVACRVDDKGAFATTATASYAGGASQSDGNVSRLIDTLGPNADNAGGWLITGLKADGAVATATIDLGQVWNLRQIQTDYGNWLSTAGLNYQLNLSAVQQAVVDLGASYNLVRLSQDFYDRWPDGSLEISNDKLKWTVIKAMGTPMTDGTWVFAPQMARYIRISGAKSSARMQELQAFPAGPAIPK